MNQQEADSIQAQVDQIRQRSNRIITKVDSIFIDLEQIEDVLVVDTEPPPVEPPPVRPPPVRPPPPPVEPPADSQYPDVMFPEREAPTPKYLVEPDGTIRDGATNDVIGKNVNPWRWIVNNTVPNFGDASRFNIGIHGNCTNLASIKINTGYDGDHIKLPSGAPLSMGFIGMDEEAMIPGLQFDTHYGLNNDIGAWNLKIRRPNPNSPGPVKGSHIDGELVLCNVVMVGADGGYGDSKWWNHDTNVKVKILDNVTFDENMSAWEWMSYGHYTGELYARGCDLSKNGRGGIQQVSRNSEVPNHHTIYQSGLVYVEGCTHGGPQLNGQGGAVLSIYSADTLIAKNCNFDMVGKTKGVAALYEDRDQPKGNDGFRVRLAIFDNCKVTGAQEARSPYAAIAERVEVHNLSPGDVVSHNTSWDMIFGSESGFNNGAPEMSADRIHFYNSDLTNFRIGFYDYGTQKMRDATAAEMATVQE